MFYLVCQRYYKANEATYKLKILDESIKALKK